MSYLGYGWSSFRDHEFNHTQDDTSTRLSDARTPKTYHHAQRIAHLKSARRPPIQARGNVGAADECFVLPAAGFDVMSLGTSGSYHTFLFVPQRLCIVILVCLSP